MLSLYAPRPFFAWLRAGARFLRADRWWWVAVLLLALATGQAAARWDRAPRPPAEPVRISIACAWSGQGLLGSAAPA